MLYRFLLFFLLISTAGFAQTKKHVLLVSIDGFRPDFYKMEKWKAPTLKSLKEKGIYADGVESVFPSVTYPSHTAIITGVGPGTHGIYYNVPYQSPNGAWYWDEHYIKVPTLWDAVKSAGMSSGSVMWPVTVGAPITYNFPVRRADNDEKSDQISLTRQVVTPAGLLDQMQPSIGKLTQEDFSHDNVDITIGKMAAWIIKTQKPELMAVHFLGLDHTQHGVGREGPKVQQSLTTVDSMLNIVLKAYEAAGLQNNTDIIITGDHGFASVKRMISPNVLLAKAGLINGKEYKARFHSTGGSSFLYLKDPGDKASLEQVKKILRDLPADQQKHFRVLDRAELDKLDVNPEVALGLAADHTSALNNEVNGELIKPRKKITGSHGHDPRIPDLYTGFLGYGPSFKKQARVDKLKLTDMSALISEILNLNFKKADAALKQKVFK